VKNLPKKYIDVLHAKWLCIVPKNVKNVTGRMGININADTRANPVLTNPKTLALSVEKSSIRNDAHDVNLLSIVL
jgi:hypothetical protein